MRFYHCKGILDVNSAQSQKVGKLQVISDILGKVDYLQMGMENYPGNN